MNVIHGVRNIVGHALRPLHAGSEKLLSHDARLTPRGTAMLSLQSPAFESNGEIPRKYSGEGENISPPLCWSGIPSETRELLLICEDPDAPRGVPFVHWILYCVPPSRTSLPEHVPTMDAPASLAEILQGRNSAGETGYIGPMPPVGHGAHHYHFQLFALDASLRLDSNPHRRDLPGAMSGHVLAVAELIGTYERK